MLTPHIFTGLRCLPRWIKLICNTAKRIFGEAVISTFHHRAVILDSMHLKSCRILTTTHICAPTWPSYLTCKYEGTYFPLLCWHCYFYWEIGYHLPCELDSSKQDKMFTPPPALTGINRSVNMDGCYHSERTRQSWHVLAGSGQMEFILKQFQWHQLNYKAKTTMRVI